MQKLGDVEEARTKVRRDLTELVERIREAVAVDVTDLDSGIKALLSLRQAVYEDLNQIPHEFAILMAIERLIRDDRAHPETAWEWNPRQTGGSDEPDLRGWFLDRPTIIAEVTTSVEPRGTIEQRMRRTLEKLAAMDGRRYYFVLNDRMKRRAHSIIGDREIEVVNLFGMPIPATTGVSGAA